MILLTFFTIFVWNLNLKYSFHDTLRTFETPTIGFVQDSVWDVNETTMSTVLAI